MPQINKGLVKGLVAARRMLLCTVLGIAAVASRGAAQDDTVTVGPPPHFAAAWAPPGMLIDVSRMGPFRRRVTLDFDQVPIDSVVTQVIAKADLKLVYRPGMLPPDRLVSIHVKAVTVASALAEVLLDTGLDIVMTHGENLALIVCPHVRAGVGRQAAGSVAGRILDRQTQVALAGAIVTVDGGASPVVTNSNGYYRVSGLSAGPHTLTVKSIGYVPVTDTVVAGPVLVSHDLTLAASVQQLEQVVVTGTLVPTEVKALPTPITVITADEIRRQNVMRLLQLFRGQTAGAFAFDREADDHYNAMNVRGVTSFSTQSVKTFVDGIEMASPAFTALIDPNSIDRIELARGPQAATMYGSDAIGGVMQIFTKKGEFGLRHPGGDFRTSVGVIEKNNGSGAAMRFEDAVALRGGEQQTRYNVAAYYRHDGEWTPSYRNANWSVTASAENVHGPLTSRISALFARKVYDRAWVTALRDAGYDAYAVPPFEEIDLQTQTYGANFVYKPTSWWRNDLVVGYDRWAFNLIQTRRRFTTPADTSLQVILNQRGKLSMLYYGTLSARISRTVSATFTAGFNHYDLGGSDAFVPSADRTSGTLDTIATVLRLPSTNNGYFTQAQATIDDALSLTAGLRLETSPGFGRDIGAAFSPRFGVAYVYPVGSVTAKLRGSYGESIRAPDPAQNQPFMSADFERLYNPDLRPERQRGIDGGLDLYWGARSALSVTYYSQHAVDLIDQVSIGTSGPPARTQAQNVGKIINRGWEFEARYGANAWQVAASLSIPQSEIQELDSVYGGDYRVGDRLFDVPRWTSGVAVTLDLSRRTSVHGTVTSLGKWIDRDLVAFLGALAGEIPSRPSSRDYWITYPGFTKARIGLEQRFGEKMTGTLDVENVTNTRAVELTNADIPAPRVFTFALRISY